MLLSIFKKILDYILGKVLEKGCGKVESTTRNKRATKKIKKIPLALQKEFGERYDGSIITKSSFSESLENYNVLKNMERYILCFNPTDKTEEKYILGLKNRLIESIERKTTKKLSNEDRYYIGEFLKRMLCEVKKVVFPEPEIGQRKQQYENMQILGEIKELAGTSQQQNKLLESIHAGIVPFADRTSQNIESITYITNAPPDNSPAYENSRLDMENKILENLETRNVLLYGIGGIGKTSVAKALFKRIIESNRFCYNYKHIAWIPYYANLAESICKAVGLDCAISDARILATNWLNNNPNMILIIDNVENYNQDLLLSGLANRPVRVVLTSREKFESTYLLFEITPLDEKACVNLFYFYYDMEKDDEIVKELVKTCYFHTITIELIAKIAKNERFSLKCLNAKLKEKGLSFSDTPIYSTYDKLVDEKTLVQQLKTVFLISQWSDEEKKILEQIALLARFEFSIEQAEFFFDFFGNNVSYSLNKFVNKGWLLCAEKNFFMHSIIAESITAQNDMARLHGQAQKLISAITNLVKVQGRGKEIELQNIAPFAKEIADQFMQIFHTRIDCLFLLHLSNACLFLSQATESYKYSKKLIQLINNNNSFSLICINACLIAGNATFRLTNFERAISYYKYAYCLLKKQSLQCDYVLMAITHNIAVSMQRMGSFVESGKRYETVIYWLESKLNTEKNSAFLSECYNNYFALCSERNENKYNKMWDFIFGTNEIPLLDSLFEKTCDPMTSILYRFDLASKKLSANQERFMTFVVMNTAIIACEFETECSSFLACFKDYTPLDLLNSVYEYRVSVYQGGLPVATAGHNFAVLLFLFKGDVSEAIRLTKKAFECRVEYYGKYHPSSLSSRFNLGTFYLLLGADEKKGQEIYQELIDLAQEERHEGIRMRDAQKLAYLVKANLHFLYNQYTKEELENLANLYGYCPIERQLHETYGNFRASGKVNLIVNKDLTSINYNMFM